MGKQTDEAWQPPEYIKNEHKNPCTILEIQGTQYCEETTLHGFQYLTKPGYVTKVFWLCVITTCFSLAVYFGIFQNYLEYIGVS